ncbi:MAG: thiamine pyrophosphate-binding protein [Akkermansia sp.]
MEATVSDQLAELLVQGGVGQVFVPAGDSLNPLMSAVERAPGLRRVPLSRGDSAALAAAAASRLTGRTAVCCGSSGAGTLLLLGGLCEVQRDAGAVLALVVDIPTCHAGSRYVQECRPAVHLHSAVGFCERVVSPEQAPALLAEGLQHLRACGGAGVIVLPADMAAAAASPRSSPRPAVSCASLMPDGAALQGLAEAVNRAGRVTFLCGAGCAGARSDLMALARRVQAPIAYTLGGKEAMEAENPLAVGMTGPMGWGAAPLAVLDCDLLVLWGTDFPFSEFLPSMSPVVQVDREVAVLGRRTSIELGVQGDVREVARALLPLVDRDRSDDFLCATLCRHRRSLVELESHIRDVNEQGSVRPEYLTRLISDYAEPDAVWVADTGTPLLWVARYLRMSNSRRLLGSFRCGTLGAALAQAVGAKAAEPSRQVIALCGEDELSLSELTTLLRAHLSVKLLLCNNASEPLRATPAAARALGMRTLRLCRPAEAAGCVKRWLAEPGPALLDAHLDAGALAQTPDLSLLQHADSFAESPGLEGLRRLLYGRHCVR